MIKQEEIPHDQFQLSSSPIFVLYDTCYWCATYFDKARILPDNICPECSGSDEELTSIPITSNESFTFDHNDSRIGV